MAAVAEVPRPGVEVIQELRSVTPTVVAPTLAACITGVCKQILEVLSDDGTVNSDALLSGPAVATAEKDQTAPYNLNGLTLIVSMDGGPDQTFTFTGTNPLTAQQAATAINGASPAPSGFAAYVYTYVDGTTKYKLQLRTIGTGSAKSIRLVGGTALTDGADPLGWGSFIGYTYYGLGTYANVKTMVPQTSLPDPRSIMDELDVEEDTIRCFVDLGTEVRELLRTETFLRRGIETAPNYGLTPYDDGDGDATTPYVNLTNSLVGPNLLGAATSAQTGDGTNDLSTPRSIHNKTLIMAIDGNPAQTLKLIGQPIVSTDNGTWNYPADIQSKILALVVNGNVVNVTFTAGCADIATVVSEINARAAVVLGAGTVVAYRCTQYGAESPTGAYLGLFYGGAPSTNIVANTEVSVEDAAGGSTIDMVTIYGADAHQYQQNTGDKTDPTQPIDDIEAQIDGLWGGNVAYLTVGNLLYLKSTTVGAESKIWVSSSSTALTVLGFAAQAGSHYGNSFPVKVGDYLYGDGALVGKIVEIHSAGVQGRVKLESEVALTATKRAWYIVAKNLDLYESGWGTTYPTPDFYVDTSGDLHIKHDFLRDTQGIPVGSAAVNVMIAYTALRLDVTPEADDPALLAFDNVDDLEEALAPLTPDNPLAFGLWLALQNSGITRVYGVGVPEVSDDAPYGTVDGWQKVYDFLESQGVYGLAPMTNDLESILLGRTHVLAMSEPENKGERVIHFCLGKPTREADTIAVSGTNGDRIATGPAVFDTKVPTLSQALLAAGVNPASILVSDGVYINIASDDKHWNVTGAVGGGTQLTVNTTFAAGENDDAFYATGTFPAVIAETFSVVIRGPAISNDKDKEIETIAARGQSFASRRCRMAQLDQLRVSVDGVEQLVEGFYICAAKVGQISGNPPSMPYTNYPINGFSGVTGTKGYYSESQMNLGAGGGAEWIIQETPGVPLVSRHQLTTDLTSVETSEQSITNALDYVSIFMRVGLRNFIGRYNITPTFLDSLASVAKGMLEWLIEKKVIAGGDLNNIMQDTDNPTRVILDISVSVLYPCNYIRIILVV
jgi:hypothetical protein